MQRKKYKIIIGIFGVALTIIGWAISNMEHIKLVENIVAPKYDVSMATYKKMTNNGFTLKHGDIGFLEMVELFNIARKTLKPDKGSELRKEWQDIKNLHEWKIIQFKTLDSRLSSVPSKLKPVKSITLEIQSSNFPTITIPSVHSLDESIVTHFRNNPIFKYSAFIFWTGIIISIVSVFL